MIYKIRNLLFVFVFMSFVGELIAEPTQIHLSWSGNKVKTYSTMTISWVSDHFQTQEYVRYGTNLSNLSKVKAQETIAEDRSFQKVFLKNLQPSTTYFYCCGSDQTGWSNDYTFTTAPLPGKRKIFKVGIWGDTQNNKLNEQFGKTTQIIEQILPLKVDFTLHMGDIVNYGSIRTDWFNFMTVAQPLNAIVPMMPTLGNHDIENLQGENFQKPFSSFYQLFSLPRNGLDYSFNWDNVHFVCFFSGVAQAASKNGLLRYSPGSREYRWLEKDLSKAHSNPMLDWIVVYTHYPFYSYGWSNARWKETLSPIFEKYHVDLCLSGHKHFYERFLAISCGKPANEDNGIVYITNGTAGGLPMGPGGGKIPAMAFTSKEKMYNYSIMTIDGKKLMYEVFDQDSKKIDQLIIDKKR